LGAAGEALKVVLDTNVLVSALVLGERMAVLVDSWRRGAIRLIFTRATFDELDRVVELLEDSSGVCPDPDDDKFLSCALAGEASVLVTGDKALLGVRGFRGVEIIGPAEFITGRLALQRIFVQEAQNPLHPPFPKGERGGLMHGKSLASSKFGKRFAVVLGITQN